eukprot:m.110708 g.110708  ORF g.110708 m.110708 type:complete len:825 (-) comp14336_c0_seq4:40-2514(-)
MLRFFLRWSCLVLMCGAAIPHVRQYTIVDDVLVTYPTPQEMSLRFTFAGRLLAFTLLRDALVSSAHLKVVTIGNNGETPFEFHADFYRGRTPTDSNENYALFMHANASGIAGVLRLGGTLYQLAPGDGHHVLYSATDLAWPTHRCTAAETAPEIHRPHTPMRERRSLQTHNTCLLAGVADFRFYSFCGSDTASTVLSIISHVTFADEYFRATNFSGVTNIGVALSKAIVYTTSGADPYYRPGSWDVRQLLIEFSRRDWGDVCLAHLFTYQDFGGGIQGLAWVAPASGTGGICDGYGVHTGSHYNSGLTTRMSLQSTVPSLMAMLVTMHEIGHNFGASHDADPGACSPSSSSGGKYVMNAISVDGSDPNNFLFSSCSVNFIRPVLNSKSGCFAVRPNALCGNGRVEVNGTDGVLGTADDEECDGGFTGDACCSSQCKLLPGAACSDANSECCRGCAAAGPLLAPNGSVVRPAKQCFLSFANDALCRADTFCTNSSYSCPQPLNQKTAGSQCTNGGACMPSATPALRCVSVCRRFAAVSCRCGGAANCHVCCSGDPAAAPACPPGLEWLTRSYANGTNATACLNASTTTLAADTYLHPGFRPFTNSCTDAASVLPLSPYTIFLTPAGTPYTPAFLVLDDGSPCATGRCSAGTCTTSSSDVTNVVEFFSSLSAASVADWMRTNMVASVLLLSLVLWVPGGLVLARRDRVRVAALAERLPPKRRNTFVTRAQPAPVARTRVAPAPATREPAPAAWSTPSVPPALAARPSASAAAAASAHDGAGAGMWEATEANPWSGSAGSGRRGPGAVVHGAATNPMRRTSVAESAC